MDRIIAAFSDFESARDFKSRAGYQFAYYEIVPWFGLCVITFNFSKQQGMMLDEVFINDKNTSNASV